MTFNSRYLSATKALDAKAYLEATDIYVDLLQSDKDRIIDLTSEHASALGIHIELAQHYAVRKILVQRFQEKFDLTLDLSIFTKALPFQLHYGSEFCDYLGTWKNDSNSIQASRKIITDTYADFSKRYALSQPDPKSVSGDAYLVHWVIPDFLNLERLLPAKPRGYVNIGCGMGAFDSVYLREDRKAVPSVLIDNDSTLQRSVSHISTLNGLTQSRFATGWEKGACEADTVVSIRSCAFIYDVVEYDDLFRELTQGSQVFLDVSHDRLDATRAYFESLGAQVQVQPRFNDYKVQLFHVEF